jgi:uncharacterized zinc-type alcohol dehydrogenase-like protein
MPTTAHALHTPSSQAPFARTTIERRDLADHDVRIDVKFAGICHSDIHQARSEWGTAIFPMVPGHEIAGMVSEVGAAVTDVRVGDRVGVGCMVDSCGECAPCKDGLEQFCERGNVATYNGREYDGEPTYGGYSDHVVVREHFVCPIPDGIGLDVAAPLLCAGITTYSPLNFWKVGPGSNVAVVGLGGLGHLGVRIAAALGAEVTVLSQSLAKKDDGLRLGATHYYATSDRQTFRDLRGSFDLILNTVSANLRFDDYLSLLTVGGTMVNVGAPAEPISVRMFSLLGGRRNLAGSAIGGIAETREMLAFCAEHGIGADIEVIPADPDAVDAAYDRVTASDVRYRFVIDTAGIAGTGGAADPAATTS